MTTGTFKPPVWYSMIRHMNQVVVQPAVFLVALAALKHLKWTLR